MTGEDVDEIAAAILWLVDFAAEGADDDALVNCLKPAVHRIAVGDARLECTRLGARLVILRDVSA